MKSVFELDTPTNCKECKLCVTIYISSYQRADVCVVTGKLFSESLVPDTGRRKDCPLVPYDVSRLEKILAIIKELACSNYCPIKQEVLKGV
jgi:hypothetical protein